MPRTWRIGGTVSGLSFVPSTPPALVCREVLCLVAQVAPDTRVAELPAELPRLLRGLVAPSWVDNLAANPGIPTVLASVAARVMYAYSLVSAPSTLSALSAAIFAHSSAISLPSITQRIVTPFLLRSSRSQTSMAAMATAPRWVGSILVAVPVVSLLLLQQGRLPASSPHVSALYCFAWCCLGRIPCSCMAPYGTNLTMWAS